MASSDAAFEFWRRNLYIIAIVEFVVLMAFGFANPFLPLFIQGLGNFTDRAAAFWTGDFCFCGLYASNWPGMGHSR